MGKLLQRRRNTHEFYNESGRKICTYTYNAWGECTVSVASGLNAWRMKPDKYAVKNSGAHQGVIISFKTNASFEQDSGIYDPRVTKYGPVVSSRPGPIYVWDVKIVEGY